MSKKVSLKRRLSIVQLLLKYGGSTSAGDDEYAPLRTADQLVRTSPNAWLLAVVFDQLIPAERAWEAPYRLRQRLGHLNISRIAWMKLPKLKAAVRGGVGQPALARYPRQMAKWIRDAAQHIVEEYDGSARNIWSDVFTAGEVVERLLQIPGISLKKAHMATRILHEGDHQFCKSFRGWNQINVAVDVLVRRVWLRAGLSAEDSTKAILGAAAALHPSYPGKLDYPSWLIGREWCHASTPDCEGKNHDEMKACPLQGVCPKIAVRSRTPKRSGTRS